MDDLINNGWELITHRGEEMAVVSPTALVEMVAELKKLRENEEDLLADIARLYDREYR